MPRPSPEAIAAFAAARDRNVGQLLLKAARLLDERSVARLAAEPGAPPLRPAHTRLFPHLDFDGVRATDLAQRLGVSKQAIGVLVADLVDWGMVEQVRDPADGRARLVRYTARALEAFERGLVELGRIEQELAERLGPDALEAFREGLRVAVGILEEEGP